MGIKFRKYDVSNDFKLVGDFLIDNYQPDNRDGNFLQPAWEYMHSHPWLDEKSLDKIGIWKDSGRIVGVVHHELYIGEAFFDIHPGYPHLKREMLEHAEKYLYGKTPDGRRYLKAFINDFDKEFEALAKSRGYEKDDTFARPMSQLTITNPFQPVISLPDGFSLKSLAEENDLANIDRALYRGFNHGDEPPEIDFEGRKKMQSVPNFQKDLNIIIVTPDGNYVAYAGTWFEATKKYAYVEPVATDPDYRRIGLGKAAVLEGVRRCGELGAQVAYVGSVQPFYQAMGFKRLYTCNCWTKYLDI
ncbi:MAG: GNAT family N-acetyltransferase [Dehalococcoidales bacterium]|nr:MAG: GNAT family N-acetyltransferase [Dehalococcoidales bacterium]